VDTSRPSLRTNWTRLVHRPQDSYKAWHRWALFNFEVTQYIESQAPGSTPPRVAPGGAPPDPLAPYLVPAVAGFFRSIALEEGNVQQVRCHPNGCHPNGCHPNGCHPNGR